MELFLKLLMQCGHEILELWVTNRAHYNALRGDLQRAREHKQGQPRQSIGKTKQC